MIRAFAYSAVAISLLAVATCFSAHAADEKDRVIALEEGHIKMTAPVGWERKMPRSRIVEHEFAASAGADDKEPARITFMGAGGDVKTNVDRWKAQFEGGESTAKEVTVAGQTIHIVDIGGTFKDMPGGPFAGGKTVLRENYRMLGAIIVTKDFGQYFVKLVGPKATVAAQEKAFNELLNSLTVK